GNSASGPFAQGATTRVTYRRCRRYRMKRHIGLFIALTMLVVGPALVAGQTSAPPQRPAGQDLVGALKASPGCLGVETARTASGKQVIFAWFENKKAVLTWYYSDTHVALM